jgi:hypothetical protein
VLVRELAVQPLIVLVALPWALGCVPARHNRLTPQAEASFCESGSLPASRGDLRISRSEHRVDQQPDERDNKHPDCPSDLSYSREIGSPEEHPEDRAQPHHQEEHDQRTDKEPQEHALP